MTTRRFQLEGDSVETLRARVRHEHGPHARIVTLEKVTRGGIAGFLARQTYEATVEVDEGAESHQTGITALIADAEEAEEAFNVTVSTTGAQFDEVLQSLEAETRFTLEPERTATPLADGARSLDSHSRRALASSASTTPPTVELLSSPGALVVFVGLDSQPLNAAREAAGLLAVAGRSLPHGIRHIVDRRTAYLARADAVADDVPVVLAWRLSSARASADELRDLAVLQPDQVWVIVDARHKSDDTSNWVRMLSTITSVDAVLPVALSQTNSPESVDALGIPRGRLTNRTDSGKSLEAESDDSSERIG